jgi:predicted nucleic acid-binding protein
LPGNASSRDPPGEGSGTSREVDRPAAAGSRLRADDYGRDPGADPGRSLYAEVSIRFDRIEELEEALPEEDFLRLPLPWEAAFLAGKCFVRYQRRRGGRRSPLPDFYIGAHAAIAGLVLLTRDATRYRTYFPALEIIAP